MDLVVKAVEANTDQPWIILYVKRWLAAPMVTADGTVIRREKGTPQGSAVSPALANLFLHYALDAWLRAIACSVSGGLELGLGGAIGLCGGG
jgi:RNA-directed DNA polymerase